MRTIRVVDDGILVTYRHDGVIPFNTFCDCDECKNEFRKGLWWLREALVPTMEIGGIRYSLIQRIGLHEFDCWNESTGEVVRIVIGGIRAS